jgi:hypothetical protein
VSTTRAVSNVAEASSGIAPEADLSGA